MTKVAYGQCWICPEWFWYGVLTVPSVPVDKAGRAIDDDGGTLVYRLAPICPKCVGNVNAERAANGLAMIDADTAKLPNGHLGPMDLPGVDAVMPGPMWFVPTNGLPFPAHTVDCFDPSCPGCFATALDDALGEAIDTVMDRMPYADDEHARYENRLCPVAGLPAAVQAIPIRNAPESAGVVIQFRARETVVRDAGGAVMERTTAGLQHLTVNGPNGVECLPFCWCRPNQSCRTCGAAYGTSHEISCGCPAGFSSECSNWVDSGPCRCMGTPDAADLKIENTRVVADHLCPFPDAARVRALMQVSPISIGWGCSECQRDWTLRRVKTASDTPWYRWELNRP